MRAHRSMFVILLAIGGSSIALPAAAQPRLLPPQAPPGYLGLIVDANADGAGLKIVELAPNGPAEQAGLQVDDRIIMADQIAVNTPTDIARAMSGKRAGSEIRLRFARGGVEGEAVVLLGVPPGFEEVEDDRARPVPPQVPQDEPLPADVTDDGLLLGVRTVLPQLRDLLRIKAPGQFTRGALVQEVYAGTPAAAAGLPVDALIFAVDGRNIVSPAELISRIKRAGAGNIVELTYFANGAQQKVQVQLATPRMVGRPPAGQPLPPAPADPGLEARLGALERRMTAMEQRLVDLQRTLDALRQQR